MWTIGFALLVALVVSLCHSLGRWLIRFSPEKKSSINPTAYQPFGLGPRICIGRRLALVELVSAAAQTLRHYRIVLGKSQKRDLEIGTYSIMAAPKEKVLIRLHRLKGVN